MGIIEVDIINTDIPLNFFCISYHDESLGGVVVHRIDEIDIMVIQLPFSRFMV